MVEPAPAVSLASPSPVGRCVAWSPDGRQIAAPLVDGSIALWSPDQDDGPTALTPSERPLTTCLAWSPDGTRLLSGDEKGGVWLWDVESLRRPIASQGCGSSRAHCVAWHPDGLRVAVGGDGPTVTICDAEGLAVAKEIRSRSPTHWTYAIAWSPDGERLAVGSQSEALRVWDGNVEKLLWEFGNIAEYVLSLSWSPSGEELCAGYQGQSVLVFDSATGKLTVELEGYADEVTATSFSGDGRVLASMDVSGVLRLWEAGGWDVGAVRSSAGPGRHREWSGLAFNPRRLLLAVAEDSLNLYEIDLPSAAGRTAAAAETVRHASAKIVMVGESNVGKSCLAMRLAEDRYPLDSEQVTTHGMRFWSMDAKALHADAVTSADHRREVVLWDFGGQHEYRLVHQLFLQDTALAMVLFDPTRGQNALDEVIDWNVRLDRQLRDGRATKLLVGAKQDASSDLVDRDQIAEILERCGFAAYVEVSARTGRNLDELRAALAHAIDWDMLATANRPLLFQRVRDHIEQQRAAGEVVLLVDDVVARMAAERSDVDRESVAAVSRQLAVQGMIAQTNLTEGRQALLLQVPIIERYAGSLIVAARSNPRGVPALEERLLGSPELPLPGIPQEERLPRLDERTLLECVAELMIKHGLCLRHEGLLIFPSLFPRAGEEEELEHSVSLYYDFTGPIDNIYAALVARLMVSGEFGEGRLYRNRAEFDQPGQGTCGVRQVIRPGALAHLDLYFEASAGPERRELFSVFVADHLARNGVVIRSHQTVVCSGCEREIEEDIVQTNLSAGHEDVVCPWCRTSILISEAVAAADGSVADSERRIVALQAEVERRTRVDSERTKAVVAGGADHREESGDDEEMVRLLHLSDLHFTSKTSPEVKAQALLQDIRRGDGLGFESVEYLVISGDFTDRGTSEGFEKARQFVALVNEGLGVSAERCVFVPGNHDVQDLEEAFDWYASDDRAREAEPDESRWRREGSVVFVPSPTRYSERLRAFSEDFFHKLIQRPYPLAADEQGLAYYFPATGIQFLALDSCWEIDHFHRKRASVNAAAVAHVISTADAQVAAAVRDNRIGAGAPLVRIGVWHHALQHPEMIHDLQFADLLQQAGVRLALHGDVHEANRDLFRYWREGGMHVAGAGSFGAEAEGRPESTPRLYNLLEINPRLGSVRVHTRRQLTAGGPWMPWNEWPRSDGSHGAQAFYDLELGEHVAVG